MVHWFSNNVVATFLVIVVVGMWLTKGIKGSFLGRLLFVLIGGFVILSMLVAFIQRIEAKFNEYQGDVVGFLKYKACTKFELVGALCDAVDMTDAKERSEDRRMDCIEGVLKDDGTDGGAVVKAACGLRGTGAAQKTWEDCIKREAGKHEKLAADLLNGCPAFALDPKLVHDLSEGTACPFGITAWCTTDSNKTPQPKPYVNDPSYTDCLNTWAATSAQQKRRGDITKGCRDMQPSEAKDQCYIGLLQSLAPDQAQAIVADCSAHHRLYPIQ